jgi:hypothetical protein
MNRGAAKSIGGRVSHRPANRLPPAWRRAERCGAVRGGSPRRRYRRRWPAPTIEASRLGRVHGKSVAGSPQRHRALPLQAIAVDHGGRAGARRLPGRDHEGGALAIIAQRLRMQYRGGGSEEAKEIAEDRPCE